MGFKLDLEKLKLINQNSSRSRKHMPLSTDRSFFDLGDITERVHDEKRNSKQKNYI